MRPLIPYSKCTVIHMKKSTHTCRNIKVKEKCENILRQIFANDIVRVCCVQ